MLALDMSDCLDSEGNLPRGDLRRFKRAVRMAQFIESGALLTTLESREALVVCGRRRGRGACRGLMWVTKLNDARIAARCLACGNHEVEIDGWQSTPWAQGPLPPARLDDLPD